MPATEKSFSSILNVPLHYAREPIAPYGTRGRQMVFFGTQSLHDKLEMFVRDLMDVCPFGRPEVMVTAGTFVDKPNSQHKLGHAFDLDAIFWLDHTFIANNYLSDKAFYLAIESLLRKHFGTVLQYVYDRRHEDHLHVDVGTKPDFKTSWKSYTYFAQTSMNELFGEALEEDGMWGRLTAAAVKRVFTNLGINTPITTMANWQSYLTVCADEAFRKSQPELNPKQLLSKVYEIINSAPIDQIEAKRIETGLTAFAMHEDSKDFLAQF